MTWFHGKKGLILGVANDRSIAWSIAKEVMDGGGDCGFTHLPDRPDDDRQKNKNRVVKCLDGYSERAKFVVPLDVRDDQQMAAVVARTKEQFGTIDFLLHSLAFADRDDLLRETIQTSRQGFLLAMEISAYSLLSVANAIRPILAPNSSIVTMTYFGGEKCVPGYNVMGICKAALDACMRYLAYDLGAQGIRVNAISAGPLKTLASSAVGAGEMLQLYEQMAPIGRNITHEEVGRVGAFLLSDLSQGISAEIVHVDGGYHAMGSPGRLLDRIKDART